MVGRQMSGEVTVRVDDGMCMGVQECLRLAPGTFQLKQGKADVKEDAPHKLEAVMAAAAACPNFAITVWVDGQMAFDPFKD